MNELLGRIQKLKCVSKQLALLNGVQGLKKGSENQYSLFALKAIALIHDKSGGSLKINLKRLGRPKALNRVWTIYNDHNT